MHIQISSKFWTWKPISSNLCSPYKSKKNFFLMLNLVRLNIKTECYKHQSPARNLEFWPIFFIYLNLSIHSWHKMRMDQTFRSPVRYTSSSFYIPSQEFHVFLHASKFTQNNTYQVFCEWFKIFLMLFWQYYWHASIDFKLYPFIKL